MSRKRTYRARPAGEEYFGLLVCVIFFACGIVIGTFAAGALDDAGTGDLQGSISGYISQIRAGTYEAPGFFQVLWSTAKYHLLVLFLGFSLLGALCLPVVSGVRGFYLSFSIAAFIRAFGSGGWPVAFALFGVSSLITVPCFFLLASQAFTVSSLLGKALIGSNKVGIMTLYGRDYFVRTGLCLAALLAAVLLELYVTPGLVVWTSSLL